MEIHDVQGNGVGYSGQFYTVYRFLWGPAKPCLLSTSNIHMCSVFRSDAQAGGGMLFSVDFPLLFDIPGSTSGLILTMKSCITASILAGLAVSGHVQLPFHGFGSLAHPSNPGTLPPLLDAARDDLSRGLESGAFSSIDPVRAYIARIEGTNAQLHTVTEINPDAIGIAEALDAARRDGHFYRTALRTETSWSIQCPACFNNVVGIKPTVGLRPRYLVVPISEHQDSVGPLARTVKDAAYLLSAIAGPDTHDNYTSASPFQEGQLPDYVAACQLSALEGRRIGIPRHLIAKKAPFDIIPGEAFESLLFSFNCTVDIIRAAGAEIVDDIFLPGWDALEEGQYMTYTLRADILSDIPKYLSKLSTNLHNISDLRDVHDFTRSYEPEKWPERDTALFDLDLETSV